MNKLNSERTYIIILKLQVCCAGPFTNNNQDVTTYPDLISVSHGMGGDGLSSTQNPWNLNQNDNQNRPDTRQPNPSVPSNVNTDSPPDIRGHRNLDLLPRNCGPFSDDFRIFGGNKTFLFEMPWMVLIAYNSRKYLLCTNCIGTKLFGSNLLYKPIK